MTIDTNTPPITRLTGRWLTIARAVWITLAVFYIGAYLAALPVYLAQPGKFEALGPGWTDAGVHTALSELGLSLDSLLAFQKWSNVALALPYFALGVFIFWRRSDDWLALIISANFIQFLSTTTFDTLAQFHPIWLVVQGIGGSLSTALLFPMFYLFPDGRFVPRWTRWAALLMAGIQVWRLFWPEAYGAYFPIVAGPFFATIIIAQVYRYWRVSNPVQRQQTKWVVFGLTVGLAPLAIYLLTFLASPNLSAPTASGLIFSLTGNLLWEVFLVIFPLSFTVAILRSRLWDIDLIIRRTLQYSVLSVLLALVYFGGVVILQRIFTSLTGQGQNQLVTVLSTLAIAALFNPIRRRVQDVIDRRFYRKKYDAAKVIAEFGATCRDETDLDKLTARLVEVVQETMQPESVSLWLKPADDRRGTTAAGGDQRPVVSDQEGKQTPRLAGVRPPRG
jgi:hypothetical protein